MSFEVKEIHRRESGEFVNGGSLSDNKRYSKAHRRRYLENLRKEVVRKDLEEGLKAVSPFPQSG